MPIVDLKPPDLTARTDVPKGFAVTPGAVDVDHGSDAPTERPAWSPTFSMVSEAAAALASPLGAVTAGIDLAQSPVMQAAMRQSNTIAAYFAAEDREAPHYKEEGFNPWDAIKGTKYEQYWDEFVDVQNSRHAELVKQRIDREQEDRKTLESLPWYQSIPAQMIAGTLDWPTLLPGGAFVRTAKGGISVLRSALSVGAAAGTATFAQEAALHSVQATRTVNESAVNIGASVLLGGLLGAAGARLLSKAEWNEAVAKLEREIAALEPGAKTPVSAGAAAVEPASLEANTIAGVAAGAVAKASRPINPILRLMQSESPVVREVASQLLENSTYLKKNFENVASDPAAETLMQEWNAGLIRALKVTNETHSEYRKAGGKLNAYEFREAVGRAMRRGDEASDPYVTKVAKAWRNEVFEPLKEAAINAGLLPKDVTVETAASYFSRLWNRNRLVAEEGRAKEIFRSYFAALIAKEFDSSRTALVNRLAVLDQELADLRLDPEARVAALSEVDKKLSQLDERFAGRGIIAKAERLSELEGQLRKARVAGDENAVKQAREEINSLREAGGDDLKTYLAERAALRRRRRNLDFNYAGLAERSDRLLNAIADMEEDNFRAMERLIKRGQRLEKELDRLDADALERRISELADRYGALARRAEASAERTARTIKNLKEAGERGSARNAELAMRAVTEAQFGPPEEAAAKRAAAKEAAERIRERRAAAEAEIQKRLEKEEQRQRKFAEEMKAVEERLNIAKNIDHDAVMEELRAAIDKIVRVTSAASMARGERIARLRERIVNLSPQRVAEREKLIMRMREEAERKFIEQWEVRNLGQGVDINSIEPAKFDEMAREVANEVYDTLVGKAGDTTRPEFITVKARGPLKERTFNIPDLLVEDFLEHNVEHVGRRYTRIMGADVELANKFGSVDLKDQIRRIHEDYARLREGVTDEKKLRDLDKRERSDVRDIEDTRDILRHGTIYLHPVEHNYARLVRSAAQVNYIRSMGEVVAVSLTDALRPPMVHGLMQFMTDVPRMALNLKAAKMSVHEAQLAGNVGERYLAHRLATISEIMDPYAARGPVEKFIENMSNVASNWNGIRIWTDFMKSIASIMTQNRILANVVQFGKIPKKERAYLAFLGIDQSMAERIAAQFAEHGETIHDIRVANTEKWTDRVAVRYYRAAINKDVDSIVVEGSVGDLPLFASTPTGRALLQFKRFSLASHQKVLLRGLQEDKARFLGGVVAMTLMGMFITYVKAVSGNRPELQERMVNNPGWWIGEGIDKSGILSVPMELANAFEKASGVNVIKTPFTLWDSGRGMSQKLQNRNLVGTLIGPTAGLIEDTGTVLGIPHRLYEGEDVTQAQKNAAVRLLPFNSYLGIRQIMNYVVNPQH